MFGGRHSRSATPAGTWRFTRTILAQLTIRAARFASMMDNDAELHDMSALSLQRHTLCQAHIGAHIDILHRHPGAKPGQHYPNPQAGTCDDRSAISRPHPRFSSHFCLLSISSLVSEYHIHMNSLPARPFQAILSAFRRSQTPRNPAAIKVAIRSLTAP